MYAPSTPFEFVDASFHSGSSHQCLFVRVTGRTQYEYHPDPEGLIPLPPDDDENGECDFAF